MGNTSSSTCVNEIYENVKKLEDIGVQLKNKYDERDLIRFGVVKEKQDIINLYESFYYPRHSLRKLEELYQNHYHLRKILRKNIKLYNEYNSTNIHVENYVKTTVNNLQPTLRVIGV